MSRYYEPNLFVYDKHSPSPITMIIKSNFYEINADMFNVHVQSVSLIY